MRVTQVRILMCMCEYMRIDKIRNKNLREKVRSALIERKL